MERQHTQLVYFERLLFGEAGQLLRVKLFDSRPSVLILPFVPWLVPSLHLGVPRPVFLRLLFPLFLFLDLSVLALIPLVAALLFGPAPRRTFLQFPFQRVPRVTLDCKGLHVVQHLWTLSRVFHSVRHLDLRARRRRGNLHWSLMPYTKLDATGEPASIRVIGRSSTSSRSLLTLQSPPVRGRPGGFDGNGCCSSVARGLSWVERLELTRQVVVQDVFEFLKKKKKFACGYFLLSANPRLPLRGWVSVASYVQVDWETGTQCYAVRIACP